MKLKIGETEFELITNYCRQNMGAGERPLVIFNINASYDQVKPLIIENQTFFVECETASGVKESIDLSSECRMFESCKNIKDATCELVMANYSDVELLQKTIDDLLEV